MQRCRCPKCNLQQLNSVFSPKPDVSGTPCHHLIALFSSLRIIFSKYSELYSMKTKANVVCQFSQILILEYRHKGKLLPSAFWLPQASLPRRPVKQFGVTQANMASQRGLLFSGHQNNLSWVISAPNIGVMYCICVCWQILIGA